MARDITTIQNEIIAAVQADPNLVGLTSPSAVAIWNLWTRVVAEGLVTEEQLNDLLRLELEQLAREAVPGTADWLQKRVLEFQYDATNPQLVTVINGKATYATVDPALRIVTRAAVKEQSNGRVLVKVAKDNGSGGLDPLTALEQAALAGYLDAIGFVGIPVDTLTLPPDRVRFDNLEIYYKRQYNPATVLNDVIAAVDEYLKNISTVNFNGTLVKTEIIDAIQAVDGVVTLRDWFPFIIIVRPASLAAPSGNTVVVSNEMPAGHAISEDDPTYSLINTITMTPDDQIPNI